MKHGDLTLYETAAICRYIDEAFDGPALQPADAAGRALMEQWISAFVDYYYDWTIKRMVIQRIVVPTRGGTPDEDMIADALPHAKHLMSVANKGLEANAYLAGSDVSIADFFLLPAVIYMGKIPEGEQVMDGLSAIQDWTGRMMSRPSFAATAPSPPGEEQAAE